MEPSGDSIESNGSPKKRVRRGSKPTDEAVKYTEHVALPECERLAGLSVGDLEKRSSLHVEAAEILDTLECALRSGDPDVLRGALEKVRNAPSEHDYIRREKALVKQAVEDLDRPAERECWKELTPENRRKVKAALLSISLGQCDPRYLELEVDFVVERLEKCSLKDSPGGGRPGVPKTLALMMAKVGAHDVDDEKAARKKIDDARSGTKTIAPLNPLRMLGKK